MTVFQFDDYQSLLRALIKENAEKRGYLTRLASAAGCQKSYLSLVVKGETHFTPEHAMRLALFLNYSDRETEYLIQLVHYGRTSFQPLKNKIAIQLKALKNEKQDLSARFQQDSLDDERKQQIYYSSWIPSAIHLIVDIEKFRTPGAIAKHLNLPVEIVLSQLEQLEKLGLIKKQNSQWLPLGKGLHLPKSSFMTTINHQNWRGRALIDSQKQNSDSIHYTAVQTLSTSDFELIKDELLKFIDKKRKILAPSKEEELTCFTCDWFKV